MTVVSRLEWLKREEIKLFGDKVNQYSLQPKDLSEHLRKVNEAFHFSRLDFAQLQD